MMHHLTMRRNCIAIYRNHFTKHDNNLIEELDKLDAKIATARIKAGLVKVDRHLPSIKLHGPLWESNINDL